MSAAAANILGKQKKKNSQSVKSRAIVAVSGSPSPTQHNCPQPDSSDRRLTLPAWSDGCAVGPSFQFTVNNTFTFMPAHLKHGGATLLSTCVNFQNWLWKTVWATFISFIRLKNVKQIKNELKKQFPQNQLLSHKRHGHSPHLTVIERRHSFSDSLVFCFVFLQIGVIQHLGQLQEKKRVMKHEGRHFCRNHKYMYETAKAWCFMKKTTDGS